MATIDDRLSYAVIGCAMAVHRDLGPGLGEVFYHQELAERLTKAGIAHEMKPRCSLRHRGIAVDEFEADLIVEEKLVAELKVLWGDFTPEHVLQVVCYLKFWRLDVGLLFDFGKESLCQKRVPRIERRAEFDLAEFRDSWRAVRGNENVLNEVGAAILVTLSEHGLGYRDTTYRGLLTAELLHRKISCERDVRVPVQCGGRCLGETTIQCLVLPGHGALLVTALRESHQAADRAVLQTYTRHLQVAWGLHLNFGKLRVQYQWVDNREAQSP